MNKTVVFVVFSALAAMGIFGSIVLLLYRPDATATFTSFIVVILGLVVSAAGTFYALGKQGEKIDKIQTQTNGTLTKLKTERDEATKENAYLIKELLKYKMKEGENVDGL